MTIRSTWMMSLFLCILLTLVACAEERPTDWGSLNQKVRNILTLPTSEMVYKDISHMGRQEEFLGLRTRNKQVLFSVMIRVRAGIDLASENGMGLRLEPVPDPSFPDRKDKKGVRVHLPPPTILVVDADDRSIHEYFSVEQNDRITRSDWEAPIAASRERVRKDAIERGILVRARDNAEKLVGNLLTVAGFSHVEFVHESTGAAGE